MTRKRLFPICVIALAFFAGTNHFTADAEERRGPSGSIERAFGPKGGAAFRGSRSTEGGSAESSFSFSGRKRAVSGSASSTVEDGTASGTATLSTSEGRGLTASGEGSVDPRSQSASGSGTITTNSGQSVTGEGTVAKTEEGFAASGSATTSEGKTVSGTVEGDAEAGTVTVTTGEGTSKTFDGSRRPLFLQR